MGGLSKCCYFFCGRAAVGLVRSCGFPWRGRKSTMLRGSMKKWLYSSSIGGVATLVSKGCEGKLVHINEVTCSVDMSAVSASIDRNRFFSTGEHATNRRLRPKERESAWLACKVHNHCRPLGSPEAVCERVGTMMENLWNKRRSLAPGPLMDVVRLREAGVECLGNPRDELIVSEIAHVLLDLGSSFCKETNCNFLFLVFGCSSLDEYLAACSWLGPRTCMSLTIAVVMMSFFFCLTKQLLHLGRKPVLAHTRKRQRLKDGIKGSLTVQNAKACGHDRLAGSGRQACGSSSESSDDGIVLGDSQQETVWGLRPGWANIFEEDPRHARQRALHQSLPAFHLTDDAADKLSKLVDKNRVRRLPLFVVDARTNKKSLHQGVIRQQMDKWLQDPTGQAWLKSRGAFAGSSKM